MSIGFLLQATTAIDSASASVATDTVEKVSMLQFFIKGGPIMYPLLVLFVITLYITIERVLTLNKMGKFDPNFMNNIKDYVANGNLEAAKTLAKNTQSPVARMIEKGLKRLGKPLENITTSIQNTGKLEIGKMEKGLATLATISGAAPMLGFLGTVTGMINAFRAIAGSKTAVTPSMLASGIYEAMITTVTGLVIGIIAYLAYNWFIVKVESIVYKMEASSVEFIDLLQEPA
jgi:biopolymer transport protein ExbB